MPNPLHQNRLAGLLLLLCGLCTSCASGPEAPKAYAPTAINAGIAVIALKSADLNLGYVEVLPVTADGRLDVSRKRPQSTQDPATDLLPSLCLRDVQICVMPDLVPGRYVVSRMGWTDDVRYDLDASHHGNGRQGGHFSRDDIFFDVPPSGAVYLGSYVWTGNNTDKTSYSLAPAAGPSEVLAMQILLNTGLFEDQYAAWLPMINQRLTTPTPAAAVQSGTAIGRPLPMAARGKDSWPAGPLNPEDGMTVIVLNNAKSVATRLNSVPTTFDGRLDKDRRRPAYVYGLNAGQGHSLCYSPMSLCVKFDLAPGSYLLNQFGSGQLTLELGSIGLGALFGSKVIDDGGLPFVVSPHSVSWIGAANWSIEHHRIGSDKFTMEPKRTVDEKLALQTLMQIESFVQYFPGWADIVRKRLDRLEHAGQAKSPAPEKSDDAPPATPHKKHK